METDNDKTYMVLAIITFLAYAVAFGFAYAAWADIAEAAVKTTPIFQ